MHATYASGSEVALVIDDLHDDSYAGRELDPAQIQDLAPFERDGPEIGRSQSQSARGHGQCELRVGRDVEALCGIRVQTPRVEQADIVGGPGGLAMKLSFQGGLAPGGEGPVKPDVLYSVAIAWVGDDRMNQHLRGGDQLHQRYVSHAIRIRLKPIPRPPIESATFGKHSEFKRLFEAEEIRCNGQERIHQKIRGLASQAWRESPVFIALRHVNDLLPGILSRTRRCLDRRQRWVGRIDPRSQGTYGGPLFAGQAGGVIFRRPFPRKMTTLATG